MPDGSCPVEMVTGVLVVAAPAEIDVTTADQLRLVLLESAARGHTTVVVDMTGTHFCDSAGLSVLVRAHKRALAEGGELRLVIPADGAVSRIFTMTSLYRFIPRFDSLREAMLERPAAAIRPSSPRPGPGLGSPARRPGSPEGGFGLAAEAHGPDGAGLVSQGMLTASVTAGECGPMIVLSGEADLTCVEQLGTLISAQLSSGIRQLTMDVSELRFADSATIRTLVLAARTLKQRGGSMILLRPRPPVARVLALIGVEQMFTIRGETHGEPASESEPG